MKQKMQNSLKISANLQVKATNYNHNLTNSKANYIPLFCVQILSNTKYNNEDTNIYDEIGYKSSQIYLSTWISSVVQIYESHHNKE